MEIFNMEIQRNECRKKPASTYLSEENEIECGTIIFHKDTKKISFNCLICKTKFLKFSSFSKHISKHIYKFHIKSEELKRDANEVEEIQTLKTNVKEENFELEAIPNASFSETQDIKIEEIIIEKPKIDPIDICDNSNESVISNNSDKIHSDGAQNNNKKKSTNLIKKKDLVKLSKEELTCKVCLKEFSYKSKLVLHAVRHIQKKDRPLKCKICKKGFCDKKEVERHMFTHEVKQIYECEYCYAKLETKFSRNEHEKKHPEEYRQLVDKIGKCMAVQQRDETSILENEEFDSNEFIPNGYWRCKKCEKLLKNSNTPLKHEKFHEEIKPFICDLCGRGFAAKNYLNYHIMVHKQIRRFDCDKCNNSFFTSTNLRRHQAECHDMEKLFQCEICQKRFARKSTLAIHLDIHKDNRTRYKCDYCNISFYLMSALRAHKKKHRKEFGI